MWKGNSRRLAWGWLMLLGALALFRDLLSNDRPLYCRIDQEAYAPALRSMLMGPQGVYGIPTLDSLRMQESWKAGRYEYSLFAPIPFRSGEWSTLGQAGRLPPGSPDPVYGPRFIHWLGTDARGRDVAAVLVGGARTALVTGLLGAGLSLLTGIILGSLAGFWGDRKLRVSRTWVVAGILYCLMTIVFMSAWRHSFQVQGGQYGVWLLGMALASGCLGWFAGRLFRGARPVAIPLDLAIMRTAEVLESVPRLVLIIALASLFAGQSMWILIGLIGFLSWTGIAQLLRAELIRIRELGYMQAAEAAGLSPIPMLWRHALPNTLPVLAVVASFSVASAILLEASLAFLGYASGAHGSLSWGGLLSEARKYPTDWWVSIFPGLMIAFTLFSLYRLGDQHGKG
ncbi:MAG: ABC transporter permease [Saprospiraceae bacterium]|nr:ABC transporter permease [Saprospiraceae bacterium]